MKNNNTIPKPINEPIKSYAPGSPVKTSLKNCIQDIKSKTVEVPPKIKVKDFFAFEENFFLFFKINEDKFLINFI